MDAASKAVSRLRTLRDARRHVIVAWSAWCVAWIPMSGSDNAALAFSLELSASSNPGNSGLAAWGGLKGFLGASRVAFGVEGEVCIGSVSHVRRQ